MLFSITRYRIADCLMSLNVEFELFGEYCFCVCVCSVNIDVWHTLAELFNKLSDIDISVVKYHEDCQKDG